MDDEYLRSIRHWLCAEPKPPENQPEAGLVDELIPLPRTPLD
ncbi:MAG TPA: hypothetical protein VHC18_03035 [Amycolatopsis sp.]|nr:hypothetical protein [Amycolatopsis sp.]